MKTAITPREQKRLNDAPYGTIGSVVETEWGYLFNIKQMPS